MPRGGPTWKQIQLRQDRHETNSEHEGLHSGDVCDELLGREPGNDGTDLESLDLDGTEDGEPEDDEDGTTADAVPHGPVGDAEVLDDLGVDEKELRALDADDALSSIAEALGASEVLETVR